MSEGVKVLLDHFNFPSTLIRLQWKFFFLMKTVFMFVSLT